MATNVTEMYTFRWTRKGCLYFVFWVKYILRVNSYIASSEIQIGRISKFFIALDPDICSMGTVVSYSMYYAVKYLTLLHKDLILLYREFNSDLNREARVLCKCNMSI